MKFYEKVIAFFILFALIVGIIFAFIWILKTEAIPDWLRLILLIFLALLVDLPFSGFFDDESKEEDKKEENKKEENKKEDCAL